MKSIQKRLLYRFYIGKIKKMPYLHNLADEGLIKIEHHRMNILDRQELGKEALCGEYLVQK